MSCTQVLFQPYSTETYRAKHTMHQQDHYSPYNENTSGKLCAVGGNSSPRPPAEFPPNDPIFPSGTEYHQNPSIAKFGIRTDSASSNSCQLYDITKKKQEQLCTKNHTPQNVENTVCAKSGLSNCDCSHCTERPSGHQESFCRLKKLKRRSPHQIRPRCVMFNYFDGETSQEVDEHFTRALSHDVKSTLKGGTSPMSRRNFPPSFWNSNYKPPGFNQNRSFSMNDVIGVTSSFDPVTSLLPFIPRRHQAGSFAHSFDPYQTSLGFHGNLQQQITGVNEPGWNSYAGLRLSSPYNNMAAVAAAALPGMYGLSAAAVAAANEQRRYNNLFAPPVVGARASNHFQARSMEKEWSTTGYTGIRF